MPVNTETVKLGNWLTDLQTLSAPNSYVLLVGNKSDLEAKCEGGIEMAKEFSERHHLEDIEASALSGKKVKETFVRMVFEVSMRVANGSIPVGPTLAPTAVLAFSTDTGGKKKGCCK
jgi:GTPase SAR1 family protein